MRTAEWPQYRRPTDHAQLIANCCWPRQSSLVRLQTRVAFLTLALDGGKWSASSLSHFTPRERDPDIQWIGGWLGPRAGLDTMVKRKIPSPCQDSNPPDHQARSPALHHWAIPLPLKTRVPQINCFLQKTSIFCPQSYTCINYLLNVKSWLLSLYV
jgi:hypothetical protein